MRTTPCPMPTIHDMDASLQGSSLHLLLSSCPCCPYLFTDCSSSSNLLEYNSHSLLITRQVSRKKMLRDSERIFRRVFFLIFLLSNSSRSPFTKNQHTPLLFASGETIPVISEENQKKDNRRIVIGGYLPDYRIHNDLRFSYSHENGRLTDLFLFSMNIDSFSCCLTEDHFNIVKAQQDKHTRLWLTLGGGDGRSSGFAKVYNNEGRLQDFVRNISVLMEKYKLHGIVLDCEEFHSPDDYTYYCQFILFCCRQGFRVAVAVHPYQHFPRQVYSAVDAVHLMAYDIIPRQPTPYHHAHIELVRPSIEALIAGRNNNDGCPSHKIILGIPAYSRHLHNPSIVKTFAEVYDDKDSSFSVFHIETLESLVQKLELVQEYKLAGVFVWELGQDKVTNDAPTGVLFQSIFQAHRNVFNHTNTAKEPTPAHEEL